MGRQLFQTLHRTRRVRPRGSNCQRVSASRVVILEYRSGAFANEYLEAAAPLLNFLTLIRIRLECTLRIILPTMWTGSLHVDEGGSDIFSQSYRQNSRLCSAVVAGCIELVKETSMKLDRCWEILVQGQSKERASC
jgi:hypothetical protein